MIRSVKNCSCILRSHRAEIVVLLLGLEDVTTSCTVVHIIYIISLT